MVPARYIKPQLWAMEESKGSSWPDVKATLVVQGVTIA